MSDEFKAELRKAFVETTLLLVGGIAGLVLGYLLLGDHWVGKWVFPVLGAGLVYHNVRRFMRTGEEDT
jgi:hypothetical protein